MSKDPYLDWYEKNISTLRRNYPNEYLGLNINLKTGTHTILFHSPNVKELADKLCSLRGDEITMIFFIYIEGSDETLR